MKIKNAYQLKTIGENHLVTRRVNGKESILFALNESGAMLWDGICEGLDEEGLTQMLCEEYEAQSDEEALIRGDVLEFVEQLRRVDALEVE
ncbi:MAG: PqqD family protein [Lachnospiraceae bacterium]|nr:PqqD family protein [Lachnospiraceae bacterium]